MPPVDGGELFIANRAALAAVAHLGRLPRARLVLADLVGSKRRAIVERRGSEAAGWHSTASLRVRTISSVRSMAARMQVRLQKLPSRASTNRFPAPPARSTAWRMACAICTKRCDRLWVLTAALDASHFGRRAARRLFHIRHLVEAHRQRRVYRGACLCTGTSSEACRKRTARIRLKHQTAETMGHGDTPPAGCSAQFFAAGYHPWLHPPAAPDTRAARASRSGETARAAATDSESAEIDSRLNCAPARHRPDVRGDTGGPDRPTSRALAARRAATSAAAERRGAMGPRRRGTWPAASRSSRLWPEAEGVLLGADEPIATCHLLGQ